MPSSPPPRMFRARHDTADDDDDHASNRPKSSLNNVREDKPPADALHKMPADTSGNELDKRLARYTIDWNKLPGGSKENNDGEEPGTSEDDEGSDIGGPEDFTMNLEKYLLGDSPTKEKPPGEPIGNTENRQVESPSQAPPRMRTDEVEDSEFGPPVDMSTPSHLLWRKNLDQGKEPSHLQGIEETLPHSPQQPGTPSKSAQEELPEEDDTYTTVIREIEHLQEELRDRDEKLRANHQRILEAASATEEVKHLRAELHRMSTLLSEKNSKRGEEASLKEQIQILQRQNAEKEKHLREAQEKASKVDALEQQVEDLKADLIKRGDSTSCDESHSHRQQLSDAQDQLKKRDAALEDSASRLRELTAKVELQLRERNTEIDELKAQIDDRELELAQADEDLAEAKREYEALEERIGLLETRNRPLEEKNLLLETEINRTKSEMMSQRNALSVMVADLSIHTEGREYKEILDMLKSKLQSKQPSPEESPRTEADELRKEVTRLLAELKETTTDKNSMETEWKRAQDLLGESRGLINTVEGENTRLTTRVHELNSNLAEAREDVRRTKEQHLNALDSIERLREQTAAATSPVQSNPQAPNKTPDDSHQLEITKLKEAHASILANLRSSYGESTTSLRRMLTASEKRELDLRAELRALRTAHDSEISALRSDLHRLESSLATKDEAAADVDRRIARSVEKREREWERRIDLLLREREKMGKALMYAWGEKEVGGRKIHHTGAAPTAAVTDEGEEEGAPKKQPYRYKYLVRS